VVHWLRFSDPRKPDELRLSRAPAGAASWKIGPDWSAAEGGFRSGSRIWCGLALFTGRASAEAAFAQPQSYLPDIAIACEAWRALLAPFAHKGECNHLDRDRPGALFEVQPCELSGPIFVVTTAGFHPRSRREFQRGIDFRRQIDRMRSVIDSSEGSLAHQVFAALQPEDDGVTMSLWRDEPSMFAFAYKPGAHRTQVDRQRSGQTVDRSSFTRFRLLASAGTWGGADPAA